MIKAICDIPKVATVNDLRELNESLSEINLSAGLMLANVYRQNGKVFIEMFIMYDSIKTSCAFAVKEFEKKCLAYQEDEKINKYVENLKMEKRWCDLLKRVLVMIKVITQP